MGEQRQEVVSAKTLQVAVDEGGCAWVCEIGPCAREAERVLGCRGRQRTERAAGPRGGWAGERQCHVGGVMTRAPEWARSSAESGTGGGTGSGTGDDEYCERRSSAAPTACTVADAVLLPQKGTPALRRAVVTAAGACFLGDSR